MAYRTGANIIFGFRRVGLALLTIGLSFLCTVAWGQEAAATRTAWVDLEAVGFENPATFFINGERVGVNAVTVEVPFGEHKLVVQSPGYEPHERPLVVNENIIRVEIKAGDTARIRVGESGEQTVVLSRDKGSVLVMSQPPGLNVSIGGQTTRTTAEIHDVSAGTATVVVDGQSEAVEVAGGQRTTVHYDKETRAFRILYPEALQEILFQRYSHAFMSALRAMDPDSVKSFWSRLERIGRADAAWESLRKDIVEEYNKHAGSARPIHVIHTTSVLVNDIAGIRPGAKAWAEQLAAGLSKRIQAGLAGDGWQSTPDWAQALSTLYQDAPAARSAIAKPMIDAAQQALRASPPAVRKALVLWSAASTVLNGVEDRGLNALSDEVNAALARGIDREASARGGAMADLEFAVPYVGRIEGRLASALTSRLAKDLANSDMTWLQKSLELYKPDSAQIRELGDGIRKGSERLGLDEARRWTDSIKAAFPALASYSDLGYAYAVRRERGRQAARMVFDTVITRHAGTEAAEIARKENRRIQMLDDLLSSQFRWMALVVIAIGCAAYLLRFSSKSAERKARLKAFAGTVTQQAKTKAEQSSKYMESIKSNPDAGIFRLGRWCRRQSGAFASIWMIAVQPWKREALGTITFKALSVFALVNGVIYLSLLHMVSKNTPFIGSLGKSINVVFWLLILSAGALALLRRAYARHERLLPMQLIPASSVFFPALVLPGVHWMFVTAWWIAAGLAFGKAAYADATEAPSPALPPVPPAEPAPQAQVEDNKQDSKPTQE